VTQRVGIVEHELHTGLLAALRGRADIELVVLEPWKDGNAADCDVVLSVDDGPAPRHPDTRRYVTAGVTGARDVVAIRSQLRANGPRVCAPFPVSVELLAVEPSKPIDPARILVVDPPRGVREIREAMALEIVVVGLRDDAVLRDCIRPRTDGVLVATPADLDAAVANLRRRPDEVDRLGLEARAAVAGASWRRVARALLRRPLEAVPTLSPFGSSAVIQRWSPRLGSAGRWATARLDEDALVLDGQGAESARMDISSLSPLKRHALERAIAPSDARAPGLSGTVPGDAEGPATPNAPWA